MGNPLGRIVLGIALWFAVAAAVAVFMHGLSGLGIFLLVPLGMVVGPAMAMAFPFSMLFKMAYGLAMIVSALCIALGAMNRRGALGQGAVIGGFILWTILGMVGLGTGT